ncbi:MAG: BON domain-containing protein [Deltaproteobacteria bacterium]|nr:BON domain-containing protein [Deltaproteobacteria bacterium]
MDVNPVARDEEIRKRLQRVLEATDWFTDPQVRVEEGVVFLNGQVESAELKKWAGDLARNTQDVVAVVNRMAVREASAWEYSAASSGLLILWRDFIRVASFYCVWVADPDVLIDCRRAGSRGARAFLRRRIRTKLLQNVIARGAGGLVFLCGVYLILRVSGLTQLALTVVGGTGLIGLIVGIAFREIAENFLASIFLKPAAAVRYRRPGRGLRRDRYVQQLNMRMTILMTFDGNSSRSRTPSCTGATCAISRPTANRREDFWSVSVTTTRSTRPRRLHARCWRNHPAVLDDPEPSVLVDSLGRSTVNLARLLLAQRSHAQYVEGAALR